MNIKEIIVKKILERELNNKEELVFKQWLAEADNAALFNRVESMEATKVIIELEDRGIGREMVIDFRKEIAALRKNRRSTFFRKVAYTSTAAAVLAISFLVFNNKINKNEDVIQLANQSQQITKNIIETHTEAVRLITSSKEINLDNCALPENFDSNSVSSIIGNDSSILGNRNLEVELTTLVVPYKREYNIILPDGSRAWVNSGSKLTFPLRFNDTVRCVELEGEAYFEVVKNSEAPFIVKSAHLYTQVLGTAFLVTSYGDKCEVSLVEGSVNVKGSGSSSSVTLKPGRGIVYNVVNKKMSEVDINIENIINKRNGYILFDEKKLEDIVADLKRIYGVEFKFESEDLKEQTFYIKINRYDNIDDVIKLLTYTKKVNYTLDNNIVTIKRY